MDNSLLGIPLNLITYILYSFGLLIAGVTVAGFIRNYLRLYGKVWSNLASGIFLGLYSGLFNLFTIGPKYFTPVLDFSFLTVILFVAILGREGFLYVAPAYFVMLYLTGSDLTNIFVKFMFSLIIVILPIKKGYKTALLFFGLLPVYLTELAMSTDRSDMWWLYSVIAFVVICALATILIYASRKKPTYGFFFPISYYIGYIFDSLPGIYPFIIYVHSNRAYFPPEFIELLELDYLKGKAIPYTDFVINMKNNVLLYSNDISVIYNCEPGEYTIHIKTALSSNDVWLKFVIKKADLHIIRGTIVNITPNIEVNQRINESITTDMRLGIKSIYILKRDVLMLTSIDKGLTLHINLKLENMNSISFAYGLQFRESVIKKASVIIRSYVPDVLLFSFGDDEFYLFKLGISGQAEAEKIAWRILEALSKPIVVNDKTVILSATCGIRVAEYWECSDEASLDKRMEETIWALQHARQVNEGGIYNFVKADYEEEQKKVELYEAMVEIINRNSITPYFQPIIDVKNLEVFGYETLTRISGEKFKDIELFFHTAADNNLRDEAESLIFRKAYEMIRSIPDFSYNLFINKSPQTRITNDLIMLGTLLNNRGKKLVIEFTEYAHCSDEALKKSSEELRKNNFVLALDDYGKGYSTPIFLTIVAPRVLKIDMELLREFGASQSKQALFESIVDYCHKFNILCVAEGVETLEEFKYINSLDVDLVQGFFFGKPSSDVSAAMKEIEDRLREIKTLNLK